jgi:hypothetical protein
MPRVSAHWHTGAVSWSGDMGCPLLGVKGRQGKAKVITKTLVRPGVQ